MDLCPSFCVFYGDLRKLHGLMVEQGSLKSCEIALEVHEK